MFTKRRWGVVPCGSVNVGTNFVIFLHEFISEVAKDELVHDESDGGEVEW